MSLLALALCKPTYCIILKPQALSLTIMKKKEIFFDQSIDPLSHHLAEVAHGEGSLMPPLCEDGNVLS